MCYYDNGKIDRDHSWNSFYRITTTGKRTHHSWWVRIVVGKIMGKMYETYQAKEGALEFYGSRKWKRCRKNYLSIHPICERCEKLGIIKKAEIVHHKIYLDTESYKDPEKSLNFDNLEALCWDCHFSEHHRNKDCREELYFDADGNIKKG